MLFKNSFEKKSVLNNEWLFQEAVAVKVSRTHVTSTWAGKWQWHETFFLSHSDTKGTAPYVLKAATTHAHRYREREREGTKASN